MTPQKMDWIKNNLEKRPDILFAAVAVVFVSIIVANEWYFTLHLYTFGIDYWEHAGVIAEWQKNLWSPESPHVDAEGASSARYMPYYFLLTIVGNVFSLSPISTLSIGALLSSILLLCGVKLFFNEYFKNNWASVIAIMVLLSFWGFGWTWSNLYQLRSLMYVAAYPSTFVFSLSFIALWLTIRTIRSNEQTYVQYGLLAILTFLLITCHPLTGAFSVGTMGLMLLLEPKVKFAGRIKPIIAILIGAFLTELWPYFSSFDVVFNSSTTGQTSQSWLQTVAAKKEGSRLLHLTQTHPFYDWRELLVTFGPALIGIVASTWLLIRRQHLFIPIGLCMMLIPYLANLYLRIPMGHRFILFAAIFLHLSIVWNVIFIFKKQMGKTANWVKGGIVVLFIGLFSINLILVVGEFQGVKIDAQLTKSYRQSNAETIPQILSPLAAILPKDAITMAEPIIGWSLTTFKGKTVSLHHPNPLVKDYKVRKRDVKTFYDVSTGIDIKLAILDKYNVTHIVFEPGKQAHSEVLRQLSYSQSDIVSVNRFALVNVGR